MTRYQRLMRLPEPYALRHYGPTVILTLVSIALTRHPAATP